MISEQEAREAAARIVAYDTGTPLSRVYLHVTDPIEAANNDAWDLARQHIKELARREAERVELGKPIDAEWLESIGAYHEWNHGGDAGWYGLEIDDDEWLSVSGATGFTRIVMCDGVKQIERRFDTRGQLLDLLAALKGGA